MALRARPNGEQQNLLKKTKTNEQTSGVLVKTMEEYKVKRRIRVANKSKNQKRKRVNGRDGAPALIHRPAAIEAAPSPEKRGECSHTASRPYSAAARAPVSRSARSAPDTVRVMFKQHHYYYGVLATSEYCTTNDFLMCSTTRFGEGRPHGPRVRLR